MGTVCILVTDPTFGGHYLIIMPINTRMCATCNLEILRVEIEPSNILAPVGNVNIFSDVFFRIIQKGRYNLRKHKLEDG